MAKITCFNCGRTFYGSKNKFFCSKKCRYNYYHPQIKINPIPLFLSGFIFIFGSTILLMINNLESRSPDIYKAYVVNQKEIYKEQKITKDEYNFIKDVKAKDQLGDKPTNKEIEKIKKILIK